MDYNTDLLNTNNSYSSYLAGGGEMGNMIRLFDWSSTSLSTPDTWPKSLLTTISILLNTRFAMILFWGNESVQFYNDAYRESLGANGIHPWALGRPGKDSWKDSWSFIKKEIDHVMTTGEPTWRDNEKLVLNRKGTMETTYWTYSYGQVKGDNGEAQGALTICHEVTETISNVTRIQDLNEELTAANEELAASNEEMAATNEELSEAQNHLQMMIVQLAENESKFRKLVEQIPVAISVFETHDFIVSLPNDKMLEIWGRTAEEITGKPLLAAMPELEGQPFMKRLHDVLTTGIAYFSTEEKAFILRKNKLTEGYFNVVYQPIIEADGTINSILHIASEVTDSVLSRRKIQDLNEEMSTINEELGVTNEEIREVQKELLETNTKLTDSEEKLRMANEAAGIGYWSVDAKKGLLTLSGKYRAIFGLHAENTITPDELTSLIPEPYRGQTQEKARLSIATGKPYDVEFPFTQKSDNMLRWARCIGKARYDATYNLTTFSGIAMDITDQVLYRQKIEESEERFRTMAEGTSILIGVRDESGHAFYFNTAWETFTGKSQQGLLKSDWIDLIHTEDKERFQNVFSNAVKNKAPLKSEFRILGKDERYHWLLVNMSPRFRSDGSFAGYISACTDITEQKRDDERKNDFIGMVSHELKTPLTSLTGYIELVAYGLKKYDDTRNVNLLEKASRQVGKMTKMINGFLNVTRLESGKLQIDKTKFDMAVLVKEQEEETLSTVASHKFIFHPVVETWVEADRDKIGHVIHNLISNAVKYAPLGSVIQIACVTANGEAMVSVRDEGIGIAPEDKEKLFERFYRVESQATRSVAGFGIGLYLCAEIIQRHEGKIWVDSEFGKGSTFYFTLPVSERN